MRLAGLWWGIVAAVARGAEEECFCYGLFFLKILLMKVCGCGMSALQ